MYWSSFTDDSRLHGVGEIMNHKDKKYWDAGYNVGETMTIKKIFKSIDKVIKDSMSKYPKRLYESNFMKGYNNLKKKLGVSINKDG